MKLFKSLFITLTSFLLIGCSNPNTSSDLKPSEPDISESETESTPESEIEVTVTAGTWSSEEQALLDEYIYGYNLPCFRMQGNSELFYDDEYGCLSITGAEVTSSHLAEVAELFKQDGFTLISNYSEELIYSFTKEITYEGETRYIFVDFYALGLVYDEEWEEEYEDYVTEGTFWLDVYDPFYYSWPTEIVEYLLAYLGSDAVVPAYQADIYEIDASFIDVIGMLAIYAYTDDANAAEVYTEALEKAGYTVTYYEDSGVFSADDPTKTVNIYYYYEEGSLNLFISEYYSEDNGGEEPDVGGDTPSGTIDAEFLANEFADNIGLEGGADYDAEYETYWFAFLCPEEITTLMEAVEETIYCAPNEFVVYEEPYEDTWEDGSEGVFATLVTEDYTVACSIGSYFYGSDIVVQVEIYEI